MEMRMLDRIQPLKAVQDKPTASAAFALSSHQL